DGDGSKPPSRRSLNTTHRAATGRSHLLGVYRRFAWQVGNKLSTANPGSVSVCGKIFLRRFLFTACNVVLPSR
ncbi:MAG: hypothetical protein OXF43_06550, partial [Gammaproteobacteria bacterium]|nr:hypothetical protein [Gammaproteobacteria bacterium]